MRKSRGAPVAGDRMEHLQGRVAGVVLAGGLSTRMGHDKALLRVHGADKPDLLARSHALLADLLPRCWVSCRSDTPRSGYDCLFDAKPDQGPAAGILAALKAAQALGFAAVLALSCDMPLMDAPTLRSLLAARAAAPAGTLATLYEDAASGRPEALAAVYETASLPLFENWLAMPGGRLNCIVPQQNQCRLPYSAEDSRPFVNLNRPEDVKRVLDILGASL